MPPLDDFDHADFWTQSAYANREYVEPPPSAETLAAVEAELGYKLPVAYVALCAHQNGGTPARTFHRRPAPSARPNEPIDIAGIFSIGRNKRNSLCGELGSRFWVEEWGYPDIGVYFADCPSAGHDMVCLDYRGCGPAGEPVVVHVDQGRDYEITVVAPSFDVFIRSLTTGDEFAD